MNNRFNHQRSRLTLRALKNCSVKLVCFSPNKSIEVWLMYVMYECMIVWNPIILIILFILIYYLTVLSYNPIIVVIMLERQLPFKQKETFDVTIVDFMNMLMKNWAKVVTIYNNCSNIYASCFRRFAFLTKSLMWMRIMRLIRGASTRSWQHSNCCSGFWLGQCICEVWRSVMGNSN